MRNSHIISLQASRGLLLDSPKGDIVLVASESKPVTGNMQTELVKSVFAKDKLTNKPVNDLMLTVNENCPPNVREWIKMNLQAPQTPDSMPQDFAQAKELMRRNGETQFEYMNRLKGIAYDAELLIKTDADRAKTIQKKSSKSM